MIDLTNSVEYSYHLQTIPTHKNGRFEQLVPPRVKLNAPLKATITLKNNVNPTGFGLCAHHLRIFSSIWAHFFSDLGLILCIFSGFSLFLNSLHFSMHICVLSHVSVFLTHLAASEPNPDPIRVESVSYTQESQTDFKQKSTSFEYLVPPRVKLNCCFRQITTKNYTTTRPSGTINHNHISCAFCCALWLCPPAQCIAFWSRFVNYCLHFSLFLYCLR